MLIALLIISVGLLGVAGLQAYGLRNNVSAYHRSLANILVYDVLDSMRANREAALEGAYVVVLGKEAADFSVSNERAKIDVAIWLARLQAANKGGMLPDADGQVACTGSPSAPPVVCTVTVQWNDTRGAGEGAKQQMSVSTRL
jgi:type IV pilus assembly protein PilV